MTNQQATKYLEELETLTNKIIELTDKAKEDNNGVMPDAHKDAQEVVVKGLKTVKLAVEKFMS